MAGRAGAGKWAARREQARQVTTALAAAYPIADCALRHDTPFQLLAATILSAQCTDERVNQVTPALFARFPTAEALARAPLAEVESLVQSTGFFRAKAKNLVGMAQRVLSEFGGELPRTVAELVTLPGVGRKTANVLLGTAYGIPSGVVVDTHVGRIARLLGLTRQTDAVQVERELGALLPPEEWIMFSHRLIHHGRAICIAGRPKCGGCPLRECCARVGLPPLDAAGEPVRKPKSAKALKAAAAQQVARKRAQRKGAARKPAPSPSGPSPADPSPGSQPGTDQPRKAARKAARTRAPARHLPLKARPGRSRAADKRGNQGR
ncbi:MAG: endonuclease III [Planctomycetaceae bacterium]